MINLLLCCAVLEHSPECFRRAQTSKKCFVAIIATFIIYRTHRIAALPETGIVGPDAARIQANRLACHAKKACGAADLFTGQFRWTT